MYDQSHDSKIMEGIMPDHKEEIIAEISDIPEKEIPDLIQLIRIFKGSRKQQSSGFSRLNQWRGGLKDVNRTSVDLQHDIAEMWRKSYVSD